jgi:hypothetical protein
MNQKSSLREGLQFVSQVLTANSTRHQEHFGYVWIVSPTRSLEMTQILGLSLALVLFGSGIWANVGGADGPLSQNKGAWVTHSTR